jgi:hypothetical protein
MYIISRASFIKPLILLATVYLNSCSSIPRNIEHTLKNDIERFSTAVIEKNVNILLEHLEITQTPNPISKSVKIFRRSKNFDEILNNLNNSETDIYEENSNIYATIKFPNGSILKMIYLKGHWFYINLHSIKKE